MTLGLSSSCWYWDSSHRRLRARIHIVQPSDSIRAALAQAQPGDRITVLPGVYHEGAADDPTALTITRDDVALVGLSSPEHPVVLQNAGR